jgi:hypothetical protein
MKKILLSLGLLLSWFSWSQAEIISIAEAKTNAEKAQEYAAEAAEAVQRANTTLNNSTSIEQQAGNDSAISESELKQIEKLALRIGDFYAMAQQASNQATDYAIGPGSSITSGDVTNAKNEADKAKTAANNAEGKLSELKSLFSSAKQGTGSDNPTTNNNSPLPSSPITNPIPPSEFGEVLNEITESTATGCLPNNSGNSLLPGQVYCGEENELPSSPADCLPDDFEGPPAPGEVFCNELEEKAGGITDTTDAKPQIDLSKPVLNGPGLKGGIRAVKRDLDDNVYQGKDLKSLIIGWTNFLLPIAALLAVVALVWAGFMYITDLGDGSRAESAKKILMYVAGGILLILASYAIVNTIIRATF